MFIAKHCAKAKRLLLYKFRRKTLHLYRLPTGTAHIFEIIRHISERLSVIARHSLDYINARFTLPVLFIL